MAEIIKLDPDTLTVSELLKRSSELKGCIILGTNPDDSISFGVANLNKKDCVYMLELCKHLIMRMEE
jgi:hypothetical protein